jgi:hypothetical protein
VTGPLIAVEVHEDTETLATTISRDVDDGWMLLPRDLVERFEEAHMLFRAVEAEVSAYIKAHGLESNYDDEPPEDGRG